MYIKQHAYDASIRLSAVTPSNYAAGIVAGQAKNLYEKK